MSDMATTDFSDYAAKAAALRERARQARAASAESFERSDTDGYLSQWASDVTARLYDLQAEVAERGGRFEFAALFDLDGNLVPAKLVETRYGMAWGLLASDDPHGEIVGWVNAFPKRKSTMARKGYSEGSVLAPAWAATEGAHMVNVQPVVYRTDGGFSRDVEIVTDGRSE